MRVKKKRMIHKHATPSIESVYKKRNRYKLFSRWIGSNLLTTILSTFSSFTIMACFQFIAYDFLAVSRGVCTSQWMNSSSALNIWKKMKKNWKGKLQNTLRNTIFSWNYVLNMHTTKIIPENVKQIEGIIFKVTSANKMLLKIWPVFIYFSHKAIHSCKFGR